MAYPPPVLPIDKTNTTPQQDTHAAQHNTTNAAVNDVVGYLQAGANAIGCRLFLTGTPQTVAANSVTPLLFNWVDFDPAAIRSPAGATSSGFRVPAGMGGLWLIGATVKFAANSQGQRVLMLQRGGQGADAVGQIEVGASNFGPVSLSTTVILNLAAGAEIIACCLHTAKDVGGNPVSLTVIGGADAWSTPTTFYAYRLPNPIRQTPVATTLPGPGDPDELNPLEDLEVDPDQGALDL